MDDRRRGLRGRTPARLRVGQDSRSGLATARALEKFADHASLRVAHGHQSRRGKLVPPRRNGGRTSAMLAWTIVGESCVGDCRRGLRGRSSATAPCRTGGDRRRLPRVGLGSRSGLATVRALEKLAGLDEESWCHRGVMGDTPSATKERWS